jgi:hypothetical protein
MLQNMGMVGHVTMSFNVSTHLLIWFPFSS